MIRSKQIIGRLVRASKEVPVVVQFHSRIDKLAFLKYWRQTFLDLGLAEGSMHDVFFGLESRPKLSPGVYFCHQGFFVTEDSGSLFLTCNPSELPVYGECITAQVVSYTSSFISRASTLKDFSVSIPNRQSFPHFVFDCWLEECDAYEILFRAFSTLKLFKDCHPRYTYNVDVWCDLHPGEPFIHLEDSFGRISVHSIELIFDVINNQALSQLRGKRLRALCLPLSYDELEQHGLCPHGFIETLGRLSYLGHFQLLICD